jgi:inositol phosphorylceramide mannosyltransferase catalytic subunit
MKKIFCFLSVVLFTLHGYCENTTLEQLFIPWPQFSHICAPDKITKIKKFQKIYETWRKSGTTYETYRIPKILHFIWLGSPLPKIDQEMISSWKKLHPTWKVYVWTDKEAKNFPFINREAFDAAKNLSEKSDIWRYELLYRFGGIYSDTDVECLKPFDTLCKSCDFFLGLESFISDLTANNVGTTIIGSIPQHPFLLECITSIKPGPGDNSVPRIMAATGPTHLTACFLASAKKYSPNITCLPPSYFYPFDVSQKKQHSPEWLKQRYIQPETLTVHYWGMRWIIQNHQNDKKN